MWKELFPPIEGIREGRKLNKLMKTKRRRKRQPPHHWHRTLDSTQPFPHTHTHTLKKESQQMRWILLDSCWNLENFWGDNSFYLLSFFTSIIMLAVNLIQVLCLWQLNHYVSRHFSSKSCEFFNSLVCELKSRLNEITLFTGIV